MDLELVPAGGAELGLAHEDRHPQQGDGEAEGPSPFEATHPGDGQDGHEHEQALYEHLDEPEPVAPRAVAHVPAHQPHRAGGDALDDQRSRGQVADGGQRHPHGLAQPPPEATGTVGAEGEPSGVEPGHGQQHVGPAADARQTGVGGHDADDGHGPQHDGGVEPRHRLRGSRAPQLVQRQLLPPVGQPTQEPLEAYGDLHVRQRVATERDEGVVVVDLVHAEHVGEHGVDGVPAGLAGDGSAPTGQAGHGAVVGLAVGPRRQSVDDHDLGR